ncbi:signal peptide peptidase SppA [Halosquirtibacter xylanolyticus]|uniref:signal peptide peptidase SppA n=1 Tax=Halosquirtibacter xylanolyticus TaxID=3374599 RepID=UPI003748C444|nr:signal peptide peptidase SppA [Prolixibacteraceae bacterium]
MKFLRNLLASILGSIIGITVMITFGILIIAMIGVGMSSEGEVKVKDNSILVLKLDKPFVDNAADNPLSSYDIPLFDNYNSYGLFNLTKQLKDAAKDPKIKGLYIDTSFGLMAPYATATELRKSLQEFKKSGKFIYTYMEFGEQKAYYLTSISDSIILNPQGQLFLSGLTSQRTYYKRVLDKVGVDIQIMKGRDNIYKSAVEQYYRDHQSKSDKEQTTKYLNDIWSVITKDIAESRNITIPEINKCADNISTYLSPLNAIKYNLVDNLKYKDQVLSDLKDLSGVEEGKKLNTISILDYQSTSDDKELKEYHKEKIAVIFAQGAIVDKTDEREEINPDKITRVLRKARENDNVKAIVFRVNSPGGSAYGSEQMWREVELTRQVKPIIISMGDYAASGGYYISCAGSKIVADNNTITGSIGIYSFIPNAKKLVQDKIGVTFDYVSTNKNGAPLSVVDPLTPFQKNMLQTKIDQGYELFITRVAEGRNMTKEEVHKIARGRVWSGKEAVKIGLVDKIGTLQDAIKLAKEEAGVEQIKLQVLPKVKDPITELFETTSKEIQIRFMKTILGEETFEIWNNVNNIKKLNGTYMMLPYHETIY